MMFQYSQSWVFKPYTKGENKDGSPLNINPLSAIVALI